MRRFIWILIILIVSVWLGLLIAKDPGLALFSYRQWSVEMPLWFAVLCFIGILFIGYFLMHFLNRIDSAFYRFKNWRLLRRKHKAYSKTNRGLIELIEGHWKNAEYYLSEGIAESDAPLINYLALAKAAHERGDYDRRDAYLRKANAKTPHADVAIGLTQAQLQLNQGQFEQALATLGHLRQIAPRHAYVLKLLERLYIRLADWKNLLKLIPSLYRSRVITRDQSILLEKKAYQELLKSLSTHHDEQALHALWYSIPRKLKKDPQIIYHYVCLLHHKPADTEEAYELINQTLKKTWDRDLVRFYGLLNTAYTSKQLAHAENWKKKYPNQAILLLTLGRLCVRCQLWGKARSYFEDSLKLEANAETYTEYGKLLEHLGDTSTAIQSYRDGLAFYTGRTALEPARLR